jgi:hypothetical protein
VWDGNGTSSLAAGLPGRMDLPGTCTVKPKSGRSRLVLAVYAEGLAWTENSGKNFDLKIPIKWILKICIGNPL